MGLLISTQSSSIDTTQTVRTDRFLQSPYQPVSPRGIVNQGTGALTLMSTAVNSVNPWGIVVDPFGRFVYVANVGDSTVGQFSINQITGALTSITTAISSGALSAPQALAADPTGRFVYVANSGTNNVSQFSINQTTGALTSITTAITAGTGPGGITVDPTGRFVYVTNYNTGFSNGSISQYSINQSTGALTSITTAIITVSIGPVGITVDPTGRYVYVANYTGSSANTIGQYSINQSTGALTQITTAIGTGGLAPRYVIVDPSGRFLYATSYLSSYGVIQYSINQSTGALTLVNTLSVSDTNPGYLAIDPNGRYLYIANYGSSTVGQYSINQSTGLLTKITIVSTGFGSSGPWGIAIDSTGRFIYTSSTGGGGISQYMINNFSANGIITGRVQSRVSSTTSITSPLAPNSDNFDQYCATAQSTAFTINADTGSPVAGQQMTFRFLDNGTARSLNWATGATKAYRAIGVTLPTTTVANKTLYVGLIYNANDLRWDVIAVGLET